MVIGGMCGEGGMCGKGGVVKGACVAKEGMHNKRGHVWWGETCGVGACMAGDMHGGGCVWQRGAWQTCMAGGVHGRGHAWWGVHGRGCVWQGASVAVGACIAGETVIAADSTHPTGMHSCC